MANTKSIHEKKERNLQVLYPIKKVKRSIGSFHPKIMILKFKNQLRVVVGSGNLATGDWMFWINSFFCLDFFKKKSLALKKFKKIKRKPRISNKKVQTGIEYMISKKYINENEFEIETDEEEVFEQMVQRHIQKLSDSGYQFKTYLDHYMQFILKDMASLMEDYLNIDFNDFNMTQDEVYLVGSLPGAYDNFFNYSYSSILEIGNK